jgi:hypothetical protein
VYLRLALPEIGTQPALYLQMIQLQFDDGNVLGKITPDIVHTDVQADY